MRFIVLVKSSAQSEAGVMPEEKALAAMGKFNEELLKRGAMLGGDGIYPSSKGARIHLADGQLRRIDGPFAEVKELVGGYWLLQFPSYDEAVATMRRAPFQSGEIEIRPLYETEDFPVHASEQAGGWRDQEDAARAAAASGKGPARIPGTRRFLSLLKADQYTDAGVAPTPTLLAEMGALIDEMNKGNVMLAGEGLKPSREGKRINFDGAKPNVIDGPFAETKELVAGFCVMQTRTFEEALEWSRRMLEIHARGVGASEGTVEVRPVYELEDFAADAREKPDGWRAKEAAFRAQH